MEQDIREMFKNEAPHTPEKLPKGHKKRFEARLDKEFPGSSKNNQLYFFMKIAAVLVVALGIGFYLLQPNNLTNEPTVVGTEVEEQEEQNAAEIPAEKQFQLSEVSPEFKKIENFYLASLNMELAKIDINDENRDLINSFMEQLADLDEEYQRLNMEISKNGPNEQSIDAMIGNLQLRLELLYKLKNKLKEINQSKDEQYENYQV
ncbi:MAG TPA: hypothetical protein VIM94_06025 [Salegentibacter sp.]|uniref:hypothetical protein n=1 Tax=Salegentibacter sp. TaxID=1903072 RepID=UPI002F92E77C